MKVFPVNGCDGKHAFSVAGRLSRCLMQLKRALLKAASGSGTRNCFCSCHFQALLPRSILESSLDYNCRIVRQFAIASVAWGVVDWWSWWTRAA
jgi:hypothetical protein